MRGFRVNAVPRQPPVVIPPITPAPVLSSPTPSGTIATQTSAVVGATTNQSSGSFYAVVDTPANLVGITAVQIIAGQNASGAAAVASGFNTVSSPSPSVPFTGLTLGTAYGYASVQTNVNGTSNIAAGSFTTASASASVDGGHFSWTSSVSFTNNNHYWFGGGLGGPVASGTNGVDFTNASFQLSGNYPPKWDNAQTLSRSLSLGWDSLYHYAVNPTNPASFGIGLDTGGAIPEVYIWYNYQEILRDVGVTTLQHKFVRTTPINTISDSAVGMYSSHWIGSTSFYESFGNNVPVPGEGGSIVNFFNNPTGGCPDDFPPYNTGNWYTYEHWEKPATGQHPVQDGAFRIKIRNIGPSGAGGSVVCNNAYANNADYPDATRVRWVELQNFFGNASPAGAHGDSGGAVVYMDDPFICWGTDVRREIYLGNASTWAACTLLIIQPWVPGEWVNFNRGVTLNKGPLPSSNLAGYWIYETDSVGNPVNSNGIQLP